MFNISLSEQREDPKVSKVEGAADPRRQGLSCSNLPQPLANAGDAVPSAFRRVTNMTAFH